MSVEDDRMELTVKIYYEDTDAGGVVYHANYLRYMERARGEWLQALGFAHRRLAEESHAAFVVRSLEISYRSPARLDDLLVVRTRPIRLGRARILFRQDIFFKDSDSLLVTATVEVVCIDPRTQRPSPIPSELRSIVSDRFPDLRAPDRAESEGSSDGGDASDRAG